jgi:hypothetical protein
MPSLPKATPARVLAILLWVCTTEVQPQAKNSWEDYKPRTIQTIIDQHQNAHEISDPDPSKPYFLLSGDSFPSQVTLVYLGQSREIRGRRKEVLKYWGRMLGDRAPANIEDLFGTEMLFQEGENPHWLAVQRPLVEHLRKEVKRGQSFNAFVMWMGGVREQEKWEWLFAMNEFDAPPSDEVLTISKDVPPIDCRELWASELAQQETPVITNRSGTVKAYAMIAVRRSDDPKAMCSATSKLFLSRSGKPFTEIKSFSENTELMVGVEMVGFSQDERKLAADFWWAEGDYVGHRPVILDMESGNVLFGELGQQVINQLPSCDYNEDFVEVSNDGQAIIHVPESHYVQEGCPAQGYWLFDLSTGKVKRQER